MAPNEKGLSAVLELRPTQMTVGLREVARKRLRLRSHLRESDGRGASLPPAPVVLGPAGALYLVDRHHWTLAMKLEGWAYVPTRPVADLGALSPAEFWSALEAKGWCRPYDGDGRRVPFAQIPSSVDALQDDPFRSLASALRRAGGFTKQVAPFSEFAWADFLRRHIPREDVALNFDQALEHAQALARGRAARHLPGWRSEADVERSVIIPSSSALAGP